MNTGKAENALFIVRVLKNNNYSMEGIQFPLKQKRIRVLSSEDSSFEVNYEKKMNLLIDGDLYII